MLDFVLSEGAKVIEGAQSRIVRFGVFELDFASKELRKSGLKIRLQEQPFQVLAMLLERPGDPVTREELLKRLWPTDVFVDFDHGLNAAVKKLRVALSDSADNPRFIETLPRHGYRFIAQVEHRGNSRIAPSITETEEFAPVHDNKPAVARPGNRGVLFLALAAALILTAVFAYLRWSTHSASQPLVARFNIALPLSDQFSMARGGLAISPNGNYVVYSATSTNVGERRLYLRSMDRNEAELLPGTEDASGPFFSPDGKWIAFSANGQLKKIGLHGGTPITICAKENPSTGAWGVDDTIYFPETLTSDGNQNGRLRRVAAEGGKPEDFTVPEKSSWEFPPRWPQVLPDGKTVLYVSGGTAATFSDDATIVAQSVVTGERKILIQGGTSPRYVPSGHLVYAAGGRLLAVRFDARHLEVTGTAFPVAEDFWQGPGGYVAYDISQSGSLVSLSGGARSVGKRTLEWVDRLGTSLPINTQAGHYSQPSLSPNGRQIAVAVGEPLRQTDIWILDLAQTPPRQLSLSKPGETAASPVWTSDGRKLIYASGAHGGSLSWKASDGSGKEELLIAGDEIDKTLPGMILAISCSPDGRSLIFQRGDPRRFNLWALNLNGEHKAIPLLDRGFTRTLPQFSPDGRWLAYTSAESGRSEVYVEPFPALGDRVLVSVGGGEEPRWSRDGRRMFYRRGARMIEVEIQTKPAFKPHDQHSLFEARYAQSDYWTNYDVSADGEHFLMLKEEDDVRANQVLHVVMNWTDELKSRASH